jgi:hypothetical protein
MTMPVTGVDFASAINNPTKTERLSSNRKMKSNFFIEIQM